VIAFPEKGGSYKPRGRKEATEMGRNRFGEKRKKGEPFLRLWPEKEVVEETTGRGKS